MLQCFIFFIFVVFIVLRHILNLPGVLGSSEHEYKNVEGATLVAHCPSVIFSQH